MINFYKVITANHMTTDVNSLGNFMMDEDMVINNCERLGIKEIVCINTCNRVAYLFYCSKEIDHKFLHAFFNINSNGKATNDLLESLAIYEGKEAIQHIMEVAGSIDSMVVGEREIFRQYREAYQKSIQDATAGDNLRLLDQMIVRTAKRILTNTRIGEKPLSIASLALTSALHELPFPPEDTDVVIIGAGQTNNTVSKILKKYPFKSFTIYNRTKANGVKLAAALQGEAFTLDEIHATGNARLIIACTSSKSPTLNKHNYVRLLGEDTDSKRVVVDLGIPQDVCESVYKMPNVIYIPISELTTLAQKNLQARKNEIKLAKEIVKDSLRDFILQYEQRKIEIALSEVPSTMKAFKERALQSVFAKELDELDDKTKLLIDNMMEYMEKKGTSTLIKTAKKAFKI